MTPSILVLLEFRHRIIQPEALELIGLAQTLAAQAGAVVQGVVIGQDAQAAKAQLDGYPLHQVLLCEVPDAYFSADQQATALCACIEQLHPAVVLISSTDSGRAIAPRAAVRCRTGLTADCTALSMRADGLLVQVRPAFGGNLMAQIVTPTARPQFATVRPGVMAPAPRTAKAPIQFADGPFVGPSGIEVLTCETPTPAPALSQAKTLVVAGKGVRDKADLAMLGTLAQLLGGQLACSRGIVERGWLPAHRQIGLSGQTVAPDLLIICGVSGAVQFMAGMRRAKTIVALSTDANAPIFSIAHHPLVADLYEVLPPTIARLRENRNFLSDASGIVI